MEGELMKAAPLVGDGESWPKRGLVQDQAACLGSCQTLMVSERWRTFRTLHSR
jgi:hypothetical protein